jgi:hypothetical protein
MAQYLELSDTDDGGPESAWIDIGHAMRLGLSVRIPVLSIYSMAANRHCILDRFA